METGMSLMYNCQRTVILELDNLIRPDSIIPKFSLVNNNNLVLWSNLQIPSRRDDFHGGLDEEGVVRGEFDD